MLEEAPGELEKLLSETLGGSSGILLQVLVNSRTVLAANAQELAVAAELRSGGVRLLYRIEFAELAAAEIERLPAIGFLAARLRFRCKSAGQGDPVPLRSWGERNVDKLGYAVRWIRQRLDAVPDSAAAPASVVSRRLRGVAGVSAGERHSIFVLEDGSMHAVGNTNVSESSLPGVRESRRSHPARGLRPGLLGDGSWYFPSYVPVRVRITEKIAAAEAGVIHNACVTDDGRLYTWGGGGYGQLGRGDCIGRSVPTAVLDRSGHPFDQVKSVSVSKGYFWPFTVAVRHDRTLWCFGGLHDHPQICPWPTQICADTLDDVVMAVAGAYDIMVLRESGQVWNCRVYSDDDGTPEWRAVPVRLADGSILTGIRQVSAYAQSRAALTESGHVLYWQAFLSGEPDPETFEHVRNEFGTGRLDFVSSICCGYGFLLMLRHSEVWAKGSNAKGMLADGSTEPRKWPVRMLHDDGTPIRDALAISAGHAHSLIMVKNDESTCAVAAGSNLNAELGDGTTLLRTLAIPVLRRTPFTRLRWNWFFHFFVNLKRQLKHL